MTDTLSVPSLAHNQVASTPMKQCRRCMEWVPISGFHVDRRAKDGLLCYCKKCHKIINNEKYLKRCQDTPILDRAKVIRGFNEQGLFGKFCGKCKKFLPFGAFGLCKTWKDGRNKICEKCRHLSYLNNPHRAPARIEKWEHERLHPGEHYCSTCKRWLNIERFGSSKNRRRGVGWLCKGGLIPLRPAVQLVVVGTADRC